MIIGLGWYFSMMVLWIEYGLVLSLEFCMSIDFYLGNFSGFVFLRRENIGGIGCRN